MRDINKTGGPAFPSHGDMGEVTQEGMTVRDYFAAKAIPLSWADWETAVKNTDEWGEEDIPFFPSECFCHIAEDAYAMADAMIAERDK